MQSYRNNDGIVEVDERRDGHLFRFFWLGCGDIVENGSLWGLEVAV